MLTPLNMFCYVDITYMLHGIYLWLKTMSESEKLELLLSTQSTFSQIRLRNRKSLTARKVLTKTNIIVLLSVLKEQTYFFASSCICSTCSFNV